MKREKRERKRESVGSVPSNIQLEGGKSILRESLALEKGRSDECTFSAAAAAHQSEVEEE